MWGALSALTFLDPTGEKRVCVGPSDDRTCWDEPDNPLPTQSPIRKEQPSLPSGDPGSLKGGQTVGNALLSSIARVKQALN